MTPDVDTFVEALDGRYPNGSWDLYRTPQGEWLAIIANHDGQAKSFHAPTIGEALTAAANHKFAVVVPPRPEPYGPFKAVKAGRIWELTDSSGVVVATGHTEREAFARETAARAQRQERIDHWEWMYRKLTTDGVEGVDWKWET